MFAGAFNVSVIEREGRGKLLFLCEKKFSSFLFA
jgi:hypothetical protein